ncbi:cell wall-active antibiotics response protein [Jeotgalibaca porci]|uniref:Cell wall-active antibiotics response protein n=2 Tax=Jeotgalibaca porci TaxID=1868793 RepID=A0A6G7WFP7_9LACT|nr:cell wall-active antibiotics response protein LiaF [Jeotgalibaca porci]QIK51008.1 cell wall-active antibiotics response protein [Jeotgalibaca porci]
MGKGLTKLFLIIEGLLLLLTAFQLVQDWELLILLLIGLIMTRASKGAFEKRTLRHWVGWFFIILSVLSTVTIWVMLAVAVIFFVINGGNIMETLNLGTSFNAPWKKKQYYGVEVVEPTNRSGKRRKQKWLGDTTIGSSIFEWDDINISVLMGDTIIDLGNTLLPDEDNVILIRKGIGQTRVIIPMGVGICLQHSAVQGLALFDNEPFHLTNESITLYSKNYATATRKIKIVSSSFFGDFEVIYL